MDSFTDDVAQVPSGREPQRGTSLVGEVDDRVWVYRLLQVHAVAGHGVVEACGRALEVLAEAEKGKHDKQLVLLLEAIIREFAVPDSNRDVLLAELFDRCGLVLPLKERAMLAIPLHALSSSGVAASLFDGLADIAALERRA